MRVTIKDVAKAAGTSTATVSKVINGSHTISKATADRVNAIIHELNYHPNSQAQNFAKRASMNIYFLTRLDKNIAFENPHMFEIMSGVQKILDKKGYTLSVKGVNEKEACSVVEQAVTQKSADAFIVHASVISRPLARLLIESGSAHIVIGYPNFESRLCWIDTNNHLSGEIATKHLIDEGFRRIAFIGGRAGDMISWHRIKGYEDALKEAAVTVPKTFLKQGDSTFHDGRRMMQQLLKLKSRPDSVICANNYIALGAVEAIQSQGLTIPDDIAIMTFDDYPFSKTVEPMLTVVNIDVFDMGIQAGNYVLSKIKKPNFQVQSYTTLPELIVRASTRK